MKLCTLGPLRLEGVKFRREKPLLLLAYLSLEGPQARRFMAELFWPDAPNAMNNLAVAINHLRKLHAAEADDRRVWVNVGCDALDLREALKAGQVLQAQRLYQGAFAESLSSDEIGPELEEWLLETREGLARELRTALLWYAEQAAQRSDYAEAGQCAERAYRLPGSAPLEPEELPPLYRLLRAAEHPLAVNIEREARELDIPLEAPVIYTQQRLRASFMGRHSELTRLKALVPGQWAWLQAAEGLGKTALLRALATAQGGRLVLGRSGLPYATLEPLLGQPDDNETLHLRRLKELGQTLLLDDWERMDPESQHLIQRLRALAPQFTVIIASRQPPAVAVDCALELSPLSAQELTELPGAFEATGGLPELVSAFLRGEPLEEALEDRLSRLGETARQVYTALNLLQEPDLTLVRRALKLPAAELVKAHEQLVGLGFLEVSGAVRSRSLASRMMRQEPLQLALLNLSLARQLPKETALPYYQQSQVLWDDEDLPQVINSYAYWASELLRRGFPKQAAELLQEGPRVSELKVLHARALERSSLFKNALELIQGLESSPAVEALRARVLYKLGDPTAARLAAAAALDGPLDAEAEALTTLGEIALRQGDPGTALELFSRSATLWQTVGDRARWLGALSNRSVARAVLGEPITGAFAEVWQETEEHLSVRAVVLTNMAQGYLQQQDQAGAERAYQDAIKLSQEIGTLDTAPIAWNGLGIIYHYSDPPKARKAYQTGLTLAQQTGDPQITAMLLANLAELDGDIPAWQQAIDLLDRGGFVEMAREVEANLQTFMQR